MNRLLFKMLLALPLFALAACAGTASQAPRATAPPDTTLRKSTATAPTPMPAEDVTRYRPVFPAPKAGPVAAAPLAKTTVTPTNQVNAPVEQRLRDQAYTNQNVKYAQGFRILAHVGLERDQAMAIRRAVISRYPEETDYLTFKQPVYRLWVGDYLTRLEAEQAMLRLRPLVPKAELQPTQVVLNKTSF